MLRRVPAVPAEVAAAAKRDRIIDHQDLLVVARTPRMDAVHAIDEPVVRQPSTRSLRPIAALDRVGQSHVPDQDVHPKAGAPGEQPLEEIAEPVTLPTGLEIRLERDPGVEVPAQQQDRVPGLGHGRFHRRDVSRTVHEQRDTTGVLHAPAGRARAE
jgi:hypothetical protein